MSLVTACATAIIFLSFAVHLATAILARRRCRLPTGSSHDVAHSAPGMRRPVSLIVPVAGLPEIERVTLNTAFDLTYRDYELIFCAPDETDPAVSYVQGLLSRKPAVPARLLIGRSKFSVNPKLDNIEKGWLSARHERVIIVDSNVLMPPDFVERMLALDSGSVGLVSSPPIGIRPESFAAGVECGFLNTCQARWLLAGDSLGFGFGHGKAMLLKRSLIEHGGGLDILRQDVAEDMAATKYVIKSGFGVRIIDRPFGQPLGARTVSQVWHRQLRWAQLRRQSVPRLYATEIFATALPPAIAGFALGEALQISGLLGLAFVLGSFHAVEGWLARSAGWPLSWRSPIEWLARDVMISIIWMIAWKRNRYLWRGNAVDMSQGGEGLGGLPTG